LDLLFARGTSVHFVEYFFLVGYIQIVGRQRRSFELAYAVVELTRQLLDLCHQMTALIATFCLPPVKPRWRDITDAGPGVGVSSRAVVFQDAEMAYLFNSDCRIRLHRAPQDPCEAERLNGAIGDDMVDGVTIDFEKEPRFF